jgi:hypothetical protein
MARGKNTTVKVILSNARVKTGTVNDDRLTEGMLIDLLNFRVGEIAKKLVAVHHPFYMSTATLTLSGSAYPLTSVDPPIEAVVKLVDSSLGIIKFVPPDEYERISSFSNLYTNSVFAVQEGEQIRITKGSGLGSHGTITLHYVRQLTDATAVGDFPDVPDSETALLTKMLCSDIYGYLGKPTGELDNEIRASLAELKAA